MYQWSYIWLCICLFFVCVPSTQAASAITLRHKHHIFTISAAQIDTWNTGRTVWLWNGAEVVPRPEWRREGLVVPVLPAGVRTEVRTGYDPVKIAATIEKNIQSSLFRPAGTVVIKGTPETGITYEGVGLTGRSIDTPRLVELLLYALEHSLTDITMPIIETQPQITVESDALTERGIVEVVTIGESDFTGSTNDRKHNVRTGLSKFNGVLLPQGKKYRSILF